MKKKNGTRKRHAIYSKKMKQYIRKILPVLKRYCLLNEWAIDLCWHAKQEAGYKTALMYISIDLVYLHATIHIQPRMRDAFWTDNSPAIFPIVSAVCHELCHIHTDPLYEYVKDKLKKGTREYDEFREIRERQTTRIASCISNQIPEKDYSYGE